MKRKLKLAMYIFGGAFLAIVLILFLLILYIDRYQTKDIPVPPRPPNVPVEALWIGGADGGVWILCEEANLANGEYYCKIYNDSENGGIWVEGVFTLFDKNKQVIHNSPKVKDLKYLFFDGTLLCLENYDCMRKK